MYAMLCNLNRKTHPKKNQNGYIFPLLLYSPTHSLPPYRPSRLSNIPLHRLSTSTLEPLQATNLPICISKRLWIILHILLTRLRARLLRARLIPHFPSPVTAKGRVENDFVITKALREITPPAREAREWRAPVRDVESLLRGIRGRGSRGRRRGDGASDAAIAWEEPYGDGIIGPLHGIHATSRVIEFSAVSRQAAVRLGFGRFDAAPGILVLVRGVDVAVIRDHVAEESGGRISGTLNTTALAKVVDGAPGGRVQRDGGGILVVDTLEDIDLARLGPFAFDAQRPEGRPGATGRIGHVSDVGDEEALVPRLCALESHALPAFWVLLLGVHA